MQLSVTQTITSTEDNYKANVNLTGEYSYHNLLQSQKYTTYSPKMANTNMKASSLTLKKTKELKIHISTAYKDNKKYTVYKVKTLN